MIRQIHSLLPWQRGNITTRFRTLWVVMYVLVTTQVTMATVPLFDHGVALPTQRPLNIAHKGACGELPEHTVEAFRLAVDQGADVIECDVCVTRDLRLVCLDESWMGSSTNVAEVFPPSRMSTYYVEEENRNITDYFSVDFTLAELKGIFKTQEKSYRNPKYDDQFPITSVEEYIYVAKAYADSPVGLYPETKNAGWVNSLELLTNDSTTIEQLLVDLLDKHGYSSSTDPCFVQSISEDSLQRLRQMTALPLVIILDKDSDISDEALERYAETSYGIAPDKRLIVEVNSAGQVSGVTDLVDRAHSFGMRVHTWTFRNEDRDLVWDYGQDYMDEYEQFFNDIHVDGYFTDFPNSLNRFFEMAYE